MKPSEIAEQLRAAAGFLDTLDEGLYLRRCSPSTSQTVRLAASAATPEELDVLVCAFGGWDGATHRLIGDTCSTLMVEIESDHISLQVFGPAAALCDRPVIVEPAYTIKRVEPAAVGS